MPWFSCIVLLSDLPRAEDAVHQRRPRSERRHGHVLLSDAFAARKVFRGPGRSSLSALRDCWRMSAMSSLSGLREIGAID